MGKSRDSSGSSWGRPRRKNAKEPSYHERSRRTSRDYEDRRRSNDSDNYRSRRDGSDGVVLHVPLPPKPEELNYIDRHGAHVQRIQPAEIDYPGRHHQRWYFFWPEKKCGSERRPRTPMQDESNQLNPYELNPRGEMQIQTTDSQPFRKNSMNQTSETLIPTPSVRMMETEMIQTSQAASNEPASYSTYTEYYDENAPPETARSALSGKFDPKDCPKCGRGRFMVQTTAAGYVTILLCFPIGMYAYLTKSCCSVERCSYCRYIRTKSNTNVPGGKKAQ